MKLSNSVVKLFIQGTIGYSDRGLPHIHGISIDTIGKRFQYSGFEDILIEADIVAPGYINGILSRHHYNISIKHGSNVFDLTKELKEVVPTMKLFDITQQDCFTAILTQYQSFIEKER